MIAAKRARCVANPCGLFPGFGAKAVVNRQHKELYAARRSPVMGEMQEREGIAAAGDGKANRAIQQGRRQRTERRCKTFLRR
jgi:hypothetical protein